MNKPNITIKKLNEENVELWNRVNENSTHSTFINTLEWISFQKSFGKNTNSFLIFDGKKPIGNFFVEDWSRRVSKYAYTPRGPVLLDDYINDSSKLVEVFKALRIFAAQYTRTHNQNAFRIDPMIDILHQKELENAGWRQSLALGQVKNTWIMRLDKPIDELFSEQKKDTRYYIRRSEREGVIVERVTNPKQVEIFNQLMKETKERNEFAGMSSEYYTKQWNLLNKEGENALPLKNSLTEIFLARYKDKYIAGALINFSNDTAHYAHGASTSDVELAKLASPYLLLWRCIEYAKQMGMKKFDFWGVIPKGVDHDWRGLSDFKMKFNGQFVQYTGTYDTYHNFFKYSFNLIIDWWNYRGLRY